MRLAAVQWGPTGFGEFILFRRNIGLLQLPLSCSLALGITRYVALARASGGSERAYGVAATLVVSVTLLLGGLACLLFRSTVSALLFGSADLQPLLGGLMAAVAGAVLHGVAYGIFRGQLDLRRANLVQFLSVGVLPLGVLSWPGLSPVEATYWIGGLWTLFATIALTIGVRRGTGAVTGPAVRAAAGELLGYGLPRVPGEFALSALFTVPVAVMARRSGVAEAGQLGFALSLVSLVSAAFAPLGVFVLPSVTTLVARDDVAHLRRDVFRMLGVCLAGAALGVLLIELLAPFVVTHGLGRDFAGTIPVIRLIALAALPYVCYVVLRNVLDAASTWPYNARNLIVATGLFGGVAALVPSAAAIAPALLTSVLVVGLLTVMDCWRVLGPGRPVPRG